MKKYLKLFILCSFVLIFMTGCIKHHTTMQVYEDGSLDLEVIYAMDSSSFEGTEEGIEIDNSVDINDYTPLKEKGFEVSEYEEKTDDAHYKGVKVKKKFYIDDLVANDQDMINLVEAFDESNFDNLGNLKLFRKDKDGYYSANFNFDYVGENSDDQAGILKGMDKNFDLLFQITLPNVAINNNATEVKGKTYIWKLKYGKPNDIILIFNIKKADNFYLLVFGGGGLIVLILIALFIISRKSKKNNEVIIDNKQLEVNDFGSDKLNELMSAPAGEVNTPIKENVTQVEEVKRNDKNPINLDALDDIKETNEVEEKQEQEEMINPFKTN